jgi:hypothetical protein
MLTPGALRSPLGDLGDSLFPGESSGELDTRLQSYLDEGYVKAAAAGISDAGDLDDAAKAWSYYRAYQAVYVRMLNNPSTVIMDKQGQNSTMWSQIEAMGKLAESSLALYQEYLPEEASTAPPSLPETASVPTQFTY